MADMFRYLMKYVGKYQVLAEYDQDTLDFPRDENGEIDSSFEDLYIQCGTKGVIKHTYRDGILCFYAPIWKRMKGTVEKIQTELPEVKLEIDELGEEALIYFLDSDLPKLEKYFHPKKLKKKVSPFDSCNLPEKPVEEVPKKTRKPRKVATA